MLIMRHYTRARAKARARQRETYIRLRNMALLEKKLLGESPLVGTAMANQTQTAGTAKALRMRSVCLGAAEITEWALVVSSRSLVCRGHAGLRPMDGAETHPFG